MMRICDGIWFINAMHLNLPISSNLNFDPSTVQRVVLCFEQSRTVTSPFSGENAKSVVIMDDASIHHVDSVVNHTAVRCPGPLPPT